MGMVKRPGAGAIDNGGDASGLGCCLWNRPHPAGALGYSDVKRALREALVSDEKTYESENQPHRELDYPASRSSENLAGGGNRGTTITGVC